ncbi:MAG: Glu-tRNA(Gln) amidotransferase subunit GatD [Candidatus Baldrarchaeia archaeon]|mgnify:CR=1 FL=1
MPEEDPLKGYRGKARQILEKFGVKVWSVVEITTKKAVLRGIILPRYEYADDKHITLKLPTGYNIGIDVAEILNIKEIGYEPGEYKLPKPEVLPDKSKPRIPFLGCGGTIACRLDYRSGAVIPALTPEELYSMVSELVEIAYVEPRLLFSLLSENMRPEYWVKIAEEVAKEINERGAHGVVLAHGTDTMSFTSAALSFMLRNLPVPVVMVGSQRSSDRPSSDAAINLINAVTVAAKSDIAEVTVCMHGTSSDNYSLIHRGTRVRKMHSSRRDAFRTIGDIPLGMVSNGKIIMFTNKYRRRTDGEVVADVKYEPKVSLLYSYPGFDPEIIDFLVDKGYKGIVFAGTGLGHVGDYLFDSIRRAIEEGVFIVMTTQCLWGFVGMNVYETGRTLLRMGVIPGHNMLPEVAYVKLMWVLGHTTNPDEVRKLIQTNIAGEITEGEPYNGYVVLQGGIPEVDKLIEKML